MRVQVVPFTTFDAIAIGNGNPSVNHTGVMIILEPPPLIELTRVAVNATDAISATFSGGVIECARLVVLKTIARARNSKQLKPLALEMFIPDYFPYVTWLKQITKLLRGIFVLALPIGLSPAGSRTVTVSVTGSNAVTERA